MIVEVSLLYVALGLVYGESNEPFAKIDHDKSIDSWVTRIPNLPILFATSPTLPSGRCERQARRFVNDLDNSTLWAIQMFDASTKYPDGIIYGHTIHLGNYDQCYELRARLTSTEDASRHPTETEDLDEVEGRYCLIGIRFRRKYVETPSRTIFTLEFDPGYSAWKAVHNYGDFRRVERDFIRMALCVPAACSAEDVATAIVEPLANLGEQHGLLVETFVLPSLCQTRRDSPSFISAGTVIFFVVIVTLVGIVVGSSWYDARAYSAGEATKDIGSKNILTTFSVRRNLRSTITAIPRHTALDCADMMRFIMILCVIFGHGASRFATAPISNALKFENTYTNAVYVPFFKLTNVVDGFFAMGGMLLAYVLLTKFDRNERITLPRIIMLRLLRLTPPYAFVILFYIFVLPHLGSGPFWQTQVQLNAERCAKNWWANLLYLNNYGNIDDMCMLQSWFLAADFHLYILGSILIGAFWKVPRKIGYLLLMAMITVSLAISFGLTYYRRLPPAEVSRATVVDPRDDFYFKNYYVKTHMRMTPYMVGILAGALIYDHGKSTWRLSKIWSRVLIVPLVLGCTVGSQLLGAKYFDPNYDHTLHPFLTATYASLQRASYAIGICSIFVLFTIGDGLESCCKLFKPRWVIPLSRLTYAVYLLHHIYQLYDFGTFRGLRNFVYNDLISALIVDTIYAHVFALVLYVALELPLRNVSKLILSGQVVVGRISTDDHKKSH